MYQSISKREGFIIHPLEKNLKWGKICSYCKKLYKLWKNYSRWLQKHKMFVDETIDPWNTGPRRRSFKRLRDLQGMRNRREPHTISRKRNIFASISSLSSREKFFFKKSWTHAESHFQAKSLYKLLDLPNMSKFCPISDFFRGGVWWNPRVWKCFGTFFSVCIDHIIIIWSRKIFFQKKVGPMLRVLYSCIFPLL